MADQEQIYVVPLRRAKDTPATRRAKRAVNELKTFIARHMKADLDKVWIDEPVNSVIWARGIQKPPTRIRVKAVKFEDDGVVEVSLPESEPGRRKAKQAAAEEARAVAEPEEKPEAAEPAAEEKQPAEAEKAAEGETPAETKPSEKAP